MLDLAIVNGLVCDTRRKKLFPASVGIRDGKIALVGEGPMEAARTIDARGLLVCPGFIDVHGHVDGHLYSGRLSACQGITTTIGGNCGLSPNSMKDFMESQEREGFPIHQMELVGHSFTLRQQVGLDDPYRKAGPAQIARMEELAEEAMRLGACGVALGLDYAPGSSLAELEAMARVNARHGRIMPVHTRLFTQADLNSLYELLAIAKRTGVKLLLSHFVYQYSGFGVLEDALEIVDRAIARGVNVRVDSGMYTDWATFVGTATFDEETIHDNGLVFGDMVVATGVHTGQRLDRELYLEMREKYPDDSLICFSGEPWEVWEVLKKPYAMPSTDTGTYAPGQGHPQIAGSFPKYFREMVLERGLLSWEEAVYKATLYPAQTFEIPGKGVLEPGYDADLALLNPRTIRDRADFPDRGFPDAPPDGLPYVIVAGEPAVDGGIYRHTRSGRLIRRPI